MTARARPLARWITSATIYSAAVMTTIGFAVASIVDAVLGRER